MVRRRAKVSLGFELLLPLVFASFVVWLVSKAAQPSRPGNQQDLTYLQVLNQETNQTGLKPPTTYDDYSYGFSRQWWGLTDIYYAPKNGFTEDIVQRMVKRLSEAYPFSDILPKGYRDEGQLVAEAENKTTYFTSTTVVIFQDTTDDTNMNNLSKLRYKLRQPDGEDPRVMFPVKYSNGPRRSQEPYSDQYTNQFIGFQTLINEAFLDKLAEAKGILRIRSVDVEVRRYPYPAYFVSDKLHFIYFVVPLAFVLGFIVTFPVIVKRVTEEKLNKSRELFRMMGMSDWVYWLTTVISYLVIVLIQMVIITAMFSIKFPQSDTVSFSAMPLFNPILAFVIFALYGLSFILFALLVAIPFSRPVLGVVVAVIIWIVTYIVPASVYIYRANIDYDATHLSRVFCCLLPNFAITMVMSLAQQVCSQSLLKSS